MKKIVSCWLLFFVCLMPVYGAWDIDLETGYAQAGYNNVKVPRDSGSLVSLTTDLSVQGREYYRLRLTRQMREHQYISVLYAPLALSASGSVPAAVSFNGTVFPAHARLNGIYRFDSYRLTWYTVFAAEKPLQYTLGFTAKIRDAAISLNDGSRSTEKKNTGFVPLLHFGAAWRVSPAFTFLIDGDAVAGGPGRAEDVMVAAAYRPDDRYTLRLGYRAVEGGADVAEVYNFALINYMVAGVSISF